MRWRRLRKWAKWTCTLAAGAAVALAVFSRFYALEYEATMNSGGTDFYAGAGEGLINVYAIERLPGAFWLPPSGWSTRRSYGWYWGISSEVDPFGAAMDWRAGALYYHAGSSWHIGVSLMYPLALTLLPTALLWYADRRRRGPGLCGSCGYDRVGLAPDAKCPECGMVPAPAAK